MLINVPSTSTVGDIKTEVLDALQSPVMAVQNPHEEFAMEEDETGDWEVPKVATTDDFELARQVKEKLRPTGRYEPLDNDAQLKNVLSNWDPVFIQFKDPNGKWFCLSDDVLNVPIPLLFAMMT